MSQSTGEFGESVQAEMEPVPRDLLSEVVADEERCEAIEYLVMQTGAVTLDDLAGFIATTPVSAEGPSQSQEQTMIQFHHIHLPKMDDAGLLDYDSDNHLIEPTEKLDLVVQRLN